VLAYVDLAGGLEAALEQVPAGAGVGQLVASDRRNLVVGSAANLRRWAASHLGLGKKPAAGKRPKTNLAGIAAAVGFAETRGPFHQRLAYERLMAPLVPSSARRDLKPPAFVQLELGERFPRALVTARPEAAFGPFRDRRAADKARDAVQKLFRLRPCDARFEPAPDLPLGLACLHAQVRSCAAPCLCRVGEDEYRGLAESAVAWLGDPLARGDAPAAVPATIASAAAGRALIVDAGHGELGLFPVSGGRVLDALARWAAAGALERELAGLDWREPAAPEPASGASDWPWLTSWLRAPKARAAYLVVRDGDTPATLASRVAAALPARAGAPRVGDKVGATRGRH
jgi:hypothetical protein